MANGVILGQTPNTNNLLPLDGSRAMTGTLQANAGILVGKKNDAPYSNIYTSPGQSLLVNSYNTLSLVNRSTDNNITRIDFSSDSTSENISFTISNAPSLILRPSSISAEKNRIINLDDGTNDTDAATVGQVNAAVQTGLGIEGLSYPAAPSSGDQFTFNGLMVRVNVTISSSTQIDAHAQQNFTALWNWWTNNATLTNSSQINFITRNMSESVSPNYDNNILFQYNVRYQTWSAIIHEDRSYVNNNSLLWFVGTN